MAQVALHNGDGYGVPSTLATAYTTPTTSTPEMTPARDVQWEVAGHQGKGRWQRLSDEAAWEGFQQGTRAVGLGSTGKGILIGMLSAFGSAALVGLIIAIVYFFRYTSRGRIFLDRISRPGEFDDEQSFLRDEEDALAEMDDLQRAEYFRARGTVAHM